MDGPRTEAGCCIASREVLSLLTLVVRNGSSFSIHGQGSPHEQPGGAAEPREDGIVTLPRQKGTATIASRKRSDPGVTDQNWVGLISHLCLTAAYIILQRYEAWKQAGRIWHDHAADRTGKKHATGARRRLVEALRRLVS